MCRWSSNCKKNDDDRREEASKCRPRNLKASSKRVDGLRPVVCLLLVLGLLQLVSDHFTWATGAPEAGADEQPKPAASSELSFEYLGLRRVPVGQFCSPVAPVNSLSLAHNQIGSLESSAFSCVAWRLRILNLRHNQIELISSQAFDGLHQLQVLLLDGNKINSIPGQTFLPLSSLRHLNLAQNELKSIGSNNSSFDLDLNFAQSNKLISLSLRLNPLVRLQAHCFRRLSRLKTLQTVQVREACQLRRRFIGDILISLLEAGQINSHLTILSQTWLLTSLEEGEEQETKSNNSETRRPLDGLDELRFLHLDGLELGSGGNELNLRRNSSKSSSKLLHKLLPIDFCVHSAAKVTSLTLKGNALETIPSFSSCPPLAQIDLSHNKLTGPLRNKSFEGLANLLDLYLGFNQISHIHQDAFWGLSKLQVLRLNNNQLKEIHPGALTPFAGSLLELDVARNELLAELSIGERLSGQLSSLRANGNYKLRRLSFKLGPQVSSLTFTYAYHCCDYLEASQLEQPNNSNRSLLRRLLSSLLGRLLHEEKTIQAADLADAQSTTEADNLTESVFVWRPKGKLEPQSLTETRAEVARQHTRRHLIDDFSSRLMGQIRRRTELEEEDEEDEEDEDEQYSNSKQRLDDYFASIMSVDDELADIVSADTKMRSRRQAGALLPSGSRTSCLPQPNPLQPCRDLFDSWWLRTAIWLVFVSAFSGNLLVLLVLGSVKSSSSHSALMSIMWLQGGHSKRHIDVPRFLVLNLAFADLLMSLYLGILAFVDLSTLGDFRSYAVRWQHSSGCQLAGFLAVLSSELSVFILAIITLERNYAITNAVHLNRRLSLQKAMLIMVIGYLLAFSMALMPLNGISDYRKFSICLPLDLSPTSTTTATTDGPNQSSYHQAYLVSLVSINSVSFLLLFGCYLRMYCAIRGSQAWNTNDLRIAKRMSILVLTDFLCWVPIIVVSGASLLQYHLVSVEGLKVITVFVLPLNSVANPFLYAITTKKFKRDLSLLKRRLVAPLTCFKSQQQHQQMNNQQVLIKRQLKTLRQDQLDCDLKKVASSKQQRNKSNNLLGENNDLMVSIRKAQQKRQAGNGNKTVHKMTQVTNYNQVTLNRTTTQCSCQLARVKLTNNRDKSNEANVELARTLPRRDICVQLDGSSSLVAGEQATRAGRRSQIKASQSRSSSQESSSDSARPTVQPKIVLDIIEPALDVALAPLGLGLVELVDGAEVLSGHELNRRHQTRDGLGVVTNHSPSSVSSQPASDPAGDHLQAARHLSACLPSMELAKACCKPHLSCRTITAGSECAAKHGPDAADVNLETVRSASACGYRTAAPLESAASNRRPNKNNCSCGQLESRTKLSTSIQRLLFSPIAKTWSSIQTSLQSVNSLKYTETVLNGQDEHVRDDHSEDRHSTLEDHLDEEEADGSGETTLEDILQLSSPARRRMLRNQTQRRMSRSCDIPGVESSAANSSDKRQSIISGDGTTTTSATKSSSSQQDDLFDDSRILLATINRMARGGRAKANFGALVKQTTQTRPAGAGRRCYRCRSWSPALLDKLEDCMYQLRSRMPNFGGAGSGGAAKSNVRHEAMQSSSELSDDQAQVEEGDQEEDDFNEMGLLEWNRQKTTTAGLGAGQFRQSRRRLRQQSSTNSDTLSTRTAATVMTNMSVSFDSNTNIPTSTTSKTTKTIIKPTD